MVHQQTVLRNEGLYTSCQKCSPALLGKGEGMLNGNVPQSLNWGGHNGKNPLPHCQEEETMFQGGGREY